MSFKLICFIYLNQSNNADLISYSKPQIVKRNNLYEIC